MMIDDTQLARLVDVGLAAAHLGQPGEALALFENLLRYRPQHVPALIGLALAHLTGNDYAGAESILREKVLAQHPAQPEALALLALCQTFAGRAADAASTLASVPPGTAAAAVAHELENCAV
jgi:thioredoxin-like negative regulator of GroEL